MQGRHSQDTTEAESNPVPIDEEAVQVSAPREVRTPVRGVRRRTAAAMVSSAFTAPHVTEFLAVDVTEAKLILEQLKSHPSFSDLRPSPLLLVANAVLWALGRTPVVNGTWDEDSQETVVKRYINLGIAAATARGLVVPNIKEAQSLSLLELAGSLSELTANAREGHTAREDMSGGTITITNIGVFGVDAATPILNPGEGAILAVGAIRRLPWVVSDGHGERLEARWVTQLSLSFDHRLVDGAEGSQFLSDVGRALNDPTLTGALEPYLASQSLPVR